MPRRRDPIEYLVESVSAWAERTGRFAFPAGSRTATANPVVFIYTVVSVDPGRASRTQVKLTDLGLTASHVTDPSLPFWRERFAAVSTYARSQKSPNGTNYVSGFPHFHQASTASGHTLGVTLLHPAPGIVRVQVPATTLFPDPTGLLRLFFGPGYFTLFDGETWLDRINTWAWTSGHAGALPTGLVDSSDPVSWTVEVTVITHTAGTIEAVDGADVFPYQRCAVDLGITSLGPGSRPPDVVGALDGLATPAPLAMDESPFNVRLFFSSNECDFIRCIADRAGEACVQLQPGGELIQMYLSPRKDNRTVVYFENVSDSGAWMVAHRLNPTTMETLGEVASFWRGPGDLGVAFETTPGAPTGAGQITAHTVGFVKQGFAGVAVQKGSLAWSTYARLAQGMNLTFVWFSSQLA